MLLTLDTESSEFLQIKHALWSAGINSYISGNNKLCLTEIPEPSGGRLVNDMIVYDGGAIMCSKLYSVYQAETASQNNASQGVQWQAKRKTK